MDAESFLFLDIRTFDSCWVFNSPMRGHGLAGPSRAGLASRGAAS
jgi:hypothetical protein